MRIIRITLFKLQALKLSELGWKYLDLDQEEISMIRDILREELNISVPSHRYYSIDDFTSNT